MHTTAITRGKTTTENTSNNTCGWLGLNMVVIYSTPFHSQHNVLFLLLLPYIHNSSDQFFGSPSSTYLEPCHRLFDTRITWITVNKSIINQSNPSCSYLLFELVICYQLFILLNLFT